MSSSTSLLKAVGSGAVMYAVEMGVSSVNGVSGNQMQQMQGAAAVAVSSYLSDLALGKSGIAIRAAAVGALTAGAEYGLRRETAPLWIFFLAGAGSYLAADSVAALAYSIQSGNERPGSQAAALDIGKLAMSTVEVGF